MRMVLLVGDRNGHLDRVAHAQRTERDPTTQGLAVEQLHNDALGAAGLFETVDVGDVRVAERGEDFGLAAEPGQAI